MVTLHTGHSDLLPFSSIFKNVSSIGCFFFVSYLISTRLRSRLLLLLLLRLPSCLDILLLSGLDMLCCGHEIVKPTFFLFLFRTYSLLLISSPLSFSFKLLSRLSTEKAARDTFFLLLFFFFFFREGNYVKDDGQE